MRLHIYCTRICNWFCARTIHATLEMFMMTCFLALCIVNRWVKFKLNNIIIWFSLHLLQFTYTQSTSTCDIIFIRSSRIRLSCTLPMCACLMYANYMAQMLRFVHPDCGQPATAIGPQSLFLRFLFATPEYHINLYLYIWWCSVPGCSVYVRHSRSMSSDNFNGVHFLTF